MATAPNPNPYGMPNVPLPFASYVKQQRQAPVQQPNRMQQLQDLYLGTMGLDSALSQVKKASFLPGSERNKAATMIRDQGSNALNAQLQYLMNDVGMDMPTATTALRGYMEQQQRLRALDPKSYKSPHAAEMIQGVQQFATTPMGQNYLQSNMPQTNNSGVGGSAAANAFNNPDVPDMIYATTIAPFLQDKYNAQMALANQTEQDLLDRASKIKDPDRRLVAANAATTLANLGRQQANQQAMAYLSPYGEKGTLGNTVGQVMAGQRTTANNIMGRMQAANGTSGAGSTDFASQVLAGQGGMSPAASGIGTDPFSQLQQLSASPYMQPQQTNPYGY